MGKLLSEMTLDELWQLFPIFLTEHDDAWATRYAAEKARLKKVLPPEAEIYHIGSTAIDGIWAKPIIDILIEVDDATDLKSVAHSVCAAGYLIMSDENERISLNKGYTQNGFADEVYHVHIRHTDDKDEVLFRDYLNAHRDIAKEYEALKLGLWKKYEHDRDGYTAAKTEFVQKHTAAAKAEKFISPTAKR